MKLVRNLNTRKFELCSQSVDCIDCNNVCKGNLTVRCDLLDADGLAECSGELVDCLIKFQSIYHVLYDVTHSINTDSVTKAILEDQVDPFVSALMHLTEIQNHLYPNLAFRAQPEKTLII